MVRGCQDAKPLKGHHQRRMGYIKLSFFLAAFTTSSIVLCFRCPGPSIRWASALVVFRDVPLEILRIEFTTQSTWASSTLPNPSRRAPATHPSPIFWRINYPTEGVTGNHHCRLNPSYLVPNTWSLLLWSPHLPLHLGAIHFVGLWRHRFLCLSSVCTADGIARLIK